MTTTESQLDTGTGYGRPKPTHDARLTDVGPGTPMGEAMRRYWQPIAVSNALTSDRPHRTRILGEDLIVFRSKRGRAGVVFERCTHRGSSLYYGRVEEDGIRCCYHGWKFDEQGHCLEQACEPGGGQRREVARQPWYPVEERYGLVFVYMGPPDRKPVLPRYDCFEEPLEEGEAFFADIPIPGQEVTGAYSDFNWLQAFENAADPVHVAWLHSQHSGYQFGGVGTTGFPEEYFNPATIWDNCSYERTPHGVMYHEKFERTDADGTVHAMDWGVELQLPNIIALPDFVEVSAKPRHDCLIFQVPSDDTSFRAFFVVRAKSPARLHSILLGITQNGKLPHELTEEDKQRYPGDFEAQGSQGPVTKHSEEVLGTTDKGVVMLRRMLRKMVDDVEAGKDPQNVDRVDPGPRHVASRVLLTNMSQGDARALAEEAAPVVSA